MFKFLRKYNKWILAVGGTLLMIVFLIPQAIEGLAHSAGTARATRATVVTPEGREQRVTASEWEQVTAEFDLINQQSQFRPVIPALGRLDGAAHWFLLTREAKEAGLVGPPGSAQLSQEQLVNLGAGARTAQRAAPKLIGVQRLLELYQGAGEVSDYRLKQYAKRIIHQADVELVVVQASAEKSAYQPTEAELQVQLDHYGSLRPGEGDMGFGYRMPDRVKLEWLSVSAEAVRDAIRESEEMDNVALRAHWMRGLRDPDSQFPPIGDDPTIPEIVREDLLDRLTQEQLDAIARFANDQFRANRRGMSQRDGYFILPADWQERQLSMSEVAREIQNRFMVESPQYHAIGDRWLEFDDLDDLEGIGRATTDRFGMAERDLYDLVSGAREFRGSAVAPVQKGVAGPPLRTRDGGVHLFRIVDADPSRAPRSVDEVRDQLVTDLQRKAHFERLAGEVSGIEEQARRDGLLATAMDHDTAVESASVSLTDLRALDRQHERGEAIMPVPTRIPGIGVNREAAEAIIDRALALPPGDLEDVPVDERVFAMAVDDSLAVLVVRIKNNQPLTREIYALSVGMIKQLMLNEELGGVQQLRDTFSLEALAQRHQFTLHAPAGQAEEELVDLDAIPASE